MSRGHVYSKILDTSLNYRIDISVGVDKKGANKGAVHRSGFVRTSV